eukprot:UN11483
MFINEEDELKQNGEKKAIKAFEFDIDVGAVGDDFDFEEEKEYKSMDLLTSRQSMNMIPSASMESPPLQDVKEKSLNDNDGMVRRGAFDLAPIKLSKAAVVSMSYDTNTTRAHSPRHHDHARAASATVGGKATNETPIDVVMDLMSKQGLFDKKESLKEIRTQTAYV